MSLAWHCDSPRDCNSWVKTSSDFDTYGFIKLEYGNEYHFCSFDCLAYWAGSKPALETFNV